MSIVYKILQLIGFEAFPVLSVSQKTEEKVCPKCNISTNSHFVIFDCMHSCCSNCADNLADNFPEENEISIRAALSPEGDTLFLCPFCEKKVENLSFE